MLVAFEEIAAVPCPIRERRGALQRHANLVLNMAQGSILFPPDLEKIRAAADRARAAIARAAPDHA